MATWAFSSGSGTYLGVLRMFMCCHLHRRICCNGVYLGTDEADVDKLEDN